MQTIYITIERDRDSRPSRAGARFRVKLRAQPGGPALLMSTRLCGSVAYAKREAQALFGALDWHEATAGAHASAILEAKGTGDELAVFGDEFFG